MSASKWILEAYKRADEEGRVDMYMSYRELRDEFEEIDACPQVPEAREEDRARAEPARKKWRLHGWFTKGWAVNN